MEEEEDCTAVPQGKKNQWLGLGTRTVGARTPPTRRQAAGGMATFVLFESSLGYSLFDIQEAEDIGIELESGTARPSPYCRAHAPSTHHHVLLLLK